jgi:putative heme transporter
MTSTAVQHTAKPKRWWQARWFQAALSLLVVVLIFGFLFPKLADYSEVWKTIGAMTGLELGTLGLAALWNLASYWPLLVAVQPGLRARQAAVANLASTAVANTLPGGGAIGVGVTVGMERTWGFPVSEIALAGIVSGIWNNFAKLGFPIIALVILAVRGEAGAGLATAAVIGLGVLIGAITLFVLLLRTPALAARIGSAAARSVGVLRRPFGRRSFVGWDDKAIRFRSDVIGLLKGRSWLITITTMISHLSLYLVLLIALRHVGVSEDEVSWAKVLAAYSFVRLLSAIPVTPGGLGVVEFGLTAALGSGLPDATKNQIAAAVLVYRALTWFAPIPLGAVAWLFWRSNTSWRRSVDERRTTQVVTSRDGVAG